MTIFRLLRAADVFTLANAALGFLAITYISDGKYPTAEFLILLAVLADGLDGIVARRFGKEGAGLGDYLDIMADYLSFCVAPSILFYRLYYTVGSAPLLTRPEDLLVGAAAGLFVGLGLLRLARHVALAGPDAGRFTGLPTTGAGLFVTLLVAVGGLGDLATALLVLALALLMVSEIPFPKVRGKLAVAAGALVLGAALGLTVWPTGESIVRALLLVALAGASAYACSGLVFTLLRVPLSADVAGAKPVVKQASAVGEATASPAQGGGNDATQLAHEIERRRAELDRVTKRLSERERRLKKKVDEFQRKTKAAGSEPADGTSPSKEESSQEIDPDA